MERSMKEDDEAKAWNLFQRAGRLIVEGGWMLGGSKLDIDKTAARFANAMSEMLGGYHQDSEINVHFDSSTSMTRALDIPFTSICAHHCLPFYGKIHIFLVPGKTRQVPGKSKYVRLANKHALRMTLEEAIAEEIADELMASSAKPKGVLVDVEAEHMCMLARGVKAHGTYTGSTAIRGCFMDQTVRMEAMSWLRKR